jgi:hypothetical protein
MAKANVRLMEGTFMDKMNARDSALLQRKRAFEKGSILRLRKSESTGFGMIEAIEPEAELFAVAEQVDLAEKAFHDALARRNEAQIAYLREPLVIRELKCLNSTECDAISARAARLPPTRQPRRCSGALRQLRRRASSRGAWRPPKIP